MGGRRFKDGAGVSLTDLFGLWAREHRRDDKPERTVGDYRQKIESLQVWLGHEDAEKITARQIIDWCDHLRDERELSPRTVKTKYLAAVRTVFRLGVERLAIAVDPTSTVRVRGRGKVKERSRGFTDDEARAILTTALCDPSALGGMAERHKLAVRWLPWIGAYTGARITELAQLRKQDFFTEAGIACIKITPEAGRVKTGEFRCVPLHPHLLEMGLLAVVKGRPEGHLFAIPGDSAQETYRRCENAGAAVAKWVRRSTGVTDKRVWPTHGWRHRFKRIAAIADIAPDYVDMIEGHSLAGGGSGKSYREADMQTLFREVQKLPRYEWPEDDCSA